MTNKKINLSQKSRTRGLLFLLFVGMVLFLWQLGSTGLFDETPPLFAASARSMHLSGDWLTPRVNGLDRFDKPPLIYWLMGLLYAIPGQEAWDPLGTWAARFPSAFSSLLMMLLIGETLMISPQNGDPFPRRTAVIASFAYALSPLVLIWSRVAVSDALLCSTLGISFLCQWRRYSNLNNQPWWSAWIVLSLAVLTKGPVAIVLMGMVLLLFGVLQADFEGLISRLKPIKGLIITILISSPWYLAELWIEGKPFWDSFFGYHNFQRLTSVVNNHYQPWWFFGLILIISSLPFTPYLIIGIHHEFLNVINRRRIVKPAETLSIFVFCWLISVLILFTFAATKLPSYWLPATPAAAILIAIYSTKIERKKDFYHSIPFLLTFIISIFVALILILLPIWINLVKDPEMPGLVSTLTASNIHLKGSILLFITCILGLFLSNKYKKGKLFFLQIPLILFHLITIQDVFIIGDKLRQLPLRQASSLLVESKKNNEPIAMVGINKPSLHFYTKNLIFYESNNEVALVNLAERLRIEKRNIFKNSSDQLRSSKELLLVIDNQTSKYWYWSKLDKEILGQFSVYQVWRLDRLSLQKRAEELVSKGVKADWQNPKPERI
tara:strand:+ start:2089 stop:3915 length:1827 start_codon:yes stop_codon:yes gene_type:complete